MANINIYGLLFNNTTDATIAQAEQIKQVSGSFANKFQSAINEELLTKVNNASSSQSNYLPLTGGTVSGNITAAKFITKGGLATQWVTGNGSLVSIDSANIPCSADGLEDASLNTTLVNIYDLAAKAYVKPSAGIPKSDLASAVQTSLGKADTALQPVSGKSLVSDTLITKLSGLQSQADMEKTMDSKISSAVASVLKWQGAKATLADIQAITNPTKGDVWHNNANGGEYAWDGTAWQELGSVIDLSAYATQSWVNNKKYGKTISYSNGSIVMALEGGTNSTAIIPNATNMAKGLMTDTQVSDLENSLRSITFTSDATSVKIIKGTNILAESDGTTMPMVSTSKAGFMTAADKVKLDATATAASVTDLQKLIYKLHMQHSLTIDYNVIEKGQTTAIKATRLNVIFDGSAVVPTSATCGSVDLSGIVNKAGSVALDTLSDSKTFTYTIVYNGATITGSKTVNAYYPKYYGSSSKGTLASADITALTKQSISSSASGTYNVAVAEGNYLWLCIPSTMNINTVKSGGFDVPMQAATTVTVTGKGDYKCYRSASTFKAGTVNIVIA